MNSDWFKRNGWVNFTNFPGEIEVYEYQGKSPRKVIVTIIDDVAEIRYYDEVVGLTVPRNELVNQLLWYMAQANFNL